jgi:hypothetical protein
VAGVVGALLWVVAPGQWVLVVAAVLCRMLLFRVARREALALSAAFAIPVVLVAVTFVLGLTDARLALTRSLTDALSPLSLLVPRLALIALSAWIIGHLTGAFEPTRKSAVSQAVLGAAFAVAIWCTLVRSRTVLALVSSPSDTLQWSEPPLLMNVAKLRSGVPLYGPPEAVTSYTYSPTIESLHTLLLAPFHWELRIAIHRMLVLGWQATTVVILCWALWPWLPGDSRVRRLGAAALALLALVLLLWSSAASPFLHPDHGLHACVALAIGLLLGRDRLPRGVFRAGVVLIPAFATMFKLTGAGVGVGLVLVLLAYDRDRSTWRLFLLAAVAALATIPLFDALFGHFSDYAIRLMARHPVNVERLSQAITFPQGRLTLLAAALALAARRIPAIRVRDETARMALLSIGIWLTTVLAFLKEGGRPNNLVAAAIPAVCTLLLAASALERRMGRGGAVLSGAAMIAILLRQTTPFDPEMLHLAAADHRVGVAFVKDDLRLGRRPLVLGSTLMWTEAGGVGIPADELHPAVELFLAGNPAFQAHLARIASGVYTSIVTPGETFVASTTRGAPFGALYQGAVEARYCVVHPLDASGLPVPLTFGRRSLVLRRRDLGCTPLASGEAGRVW